LGKLERVTGSGMNANARRILGRPEDKFWASDASAKLVVENILCGTGARGGFKSTIMPSLASKAKSCAAQFTAAPWH